MARKSTSRTGATKTAVRRPRIRRASALDFPGWVRKWRLGPGMNDRHPEILDWIGSRERLGRSAMAAEMRTLHAEGLYSGFDGSVGPGWVPLLDRLASDLVDLGWDRDLHQVKEKFGTLRFYVGERTTRMAARIRRAERESARTCEDCGKRGTTSAPDQGWMRTLCRACRAGTGRDPVVGRGSSAAPAGPRRAPRRRSRPEPRTPRTR